MHLCDMGFYCHSYIYSAHNYRCNTNIQSLGMHGCLLCVILEISEKNPLQIVEPGTVNGGYMKKELRSESVHVHALVCCYDTVYVPPHDNESM